MAWTIPEGLGGFNNPGGKRSFGAEQALSIKSVRVVTLKMSVLFEQGLESRQGWLIAVLRSWERLRSVSMFLLWDTYRHLCCKTTPWRVDSGEHSMLSITPSSIPYFPHQ
jgi:hypothetical protein